MTIGFRERLGMEREKDTLQTTIWTTDIPILGRVYDTPFIELRWWEQVIGVLTCPFVWSGMFLLWIIRKALW